MLADIVGGRLAGDSPQRELVQHVTINSEHIRRGSIFFALPGAHADGHDFVSHAISNGALAAVVGCGRGGGEANPVIEVEDPLVALQELAKWWRSRLRATVVAIVGSSGKTVTKDALVHLLGTTKRAYGSPGSFNSQIGVPLSLIECPADCDVAIIEAAATEPGEMAVLEDIVRPDHVIFTNLGARHGSNFPSTEAHSGEILSMAARVGEGWILLGDAQPAVKAAAGELAGRCVYLDDADRLPAFSVVQGDLNSTLVQVSYPDGVREPVAVKTPFQEILSDVELAISASWLLGLGSSMALAAMKDYEPTATRMEVWQSPGGWKVVRDVATADAATLGVALRVTREITRPEGRFSVILADGLDPGEADAVEALGITLAGSRADSLWILEAGANRAIGDTARALSPDLEIRYFPDLKIMRRELLKYLSRDDAVLIESPREQSLADMAKDLMEPLAATRLFIDRAALKSNVIAFRRHVGSDVQILGMVKGLAYGTNAIEVSRSLQTYGVDQLGVATVDEGAALRRANISLPVLVTLGTPTEIGKMIRYDLTPQIYSPMMLNSLIDFLNRDSQNAARLPVGIHLEIDTGMHRTGFFPEDALQVLRRLRDEPAIRLAGLMTHFSCADIPGEDEFTRMQIARFTDMVKAANDLGFTNFVKHAANTAGTLRFTEAHLDMVRIGIGLYGIYPSPETAPYLDISPVVSLVSQIVEVHELSTDDRIGYGGTYRVPSAGRRVAVVAAGYHDCVPRALSNFGYVCIDGKRCPIIGSVSMDSMVVDISSCPSATVGSDVLIYGQRGDASLPIEEVANRIGTIPYELLARVGPRVERVLTDH
jgi:alanine racemase/UDP-N-acetylmuramoyl-tripeptide--D-alanyl-D-alanine ligase